MHLLKIDYNCTNISGVWGEMLMNGEMSQICMLVNAARNAITTKKEFIYLSNEYENSIKFCFIPHRTLFREKSVEAVNPQEWFRYCMKNGVYNIKFLTPLQVSDRALLGFSNVNRSCILTFYKHNLVTYWIATWEFDRSQQKWNVEYQEYKWDNPPPITPQFENNIKEFREILLKIGAFADQIEFKNFGDIFRNAYDILSGKSEIPDTYSNGKPIHLPDVSEEKKRMFYASSVADVFGAMGSWNDSPPYYAHEKGMDSDYENLSNELLKQIKLAALYAINEN